MRLLLRLRFRAPLHVGSSTLGEETTLDYVPSDTLFSALCHAYLAAYGEGKLVNLLGRFWSANDLTESSGPPFLLSSAFPYHGETLFLPRPQVEPPKDRDEGNEGDRKLLKDLSWVPLGMFAGMLDGNGAAGPLTRERARELAGMLPDKELLPRVALDRQSSNAGIYYVQRAVFPAGGGLWALLDLRDAELEQPLRLALRLLGDMGVGGERTAGCGLFDIEFGEPPPALAGLLDGEKKFVALSRVSPDPSDAESAERYALVESRGWLHSPGGLQRKRRSAWFLAEGSSFARPVRGRLRKVTPEQDPGHEVYRYGFGIYAGRA